MTLKKNNPIWISIILGFLLFPPSSACKKEKSQAPVVISSISPSSGPYSTIVTITGSGFNANAISNTVQFNGVDAVVQSASATQLVVVVPKSAGPGAVTVKNGGQIGTGPNFNFTYTITVSTLAGNGTPGFADGNGTNAKFNKPITIALDPQGNVFVAEFLNNRIRKISPSGDVTTYAGTGTAGFADGNASSAKFNGPYGITMDSQGNLYVTDRENHCIRKINTSGVVSTFAGDGTSGYVDGNGASARFIAPAGIDIDVQGNLYVADENNNRIRKVTPSGVVSTLAGDGTLGLVNGNGPVAKFKNPTGISLDSKGNVFVAEYFNHTIRKISPEGVVSTFAGNGTSGYVDGNLSVAKFDSPVGIAFDKSDNLFVADTYNYRIRKINKDSMVSTLAGSGFAGWADGSGTTAKFNRPYGIKTDSKGNFYVAEFEGHRIRKITVE